MSPVEGNRPRRRRTLNEAAHKLEVRAGEDIAPRVANRRPPGQKRIFNEAAHKLGYWAPPTPDGREIESEAARKRFEALADYDRDVIADAGRAVLVIRHVTIRNGYHDELNVPRSLHECRKQGLLERALDLEHASYFVSRITITPTSARRLRSWRKGLFIAMARNAASPIDHFGLPSDRTVMMGSQIAV